MENEQLLTRLHELENNLQKLKDELEPPSKRKGMSRTVRKASNFLLSQWPLISLLGAIAIVLYIQFAFSVDYFEPYRSISTSKQLAEDYRLLGDSLLAKQQFVAAETAYRTALEFDKTDTAATYGIQKAQVFQPLPGEKYYVPEVAYTRLENLRLENLRHKIPNDYLIDYLYGVYYSDLSDQQDAMNWFNEAIKKNSDFTYGYITLGEVSQGNSDMQGACGYYKKT